MLSKEGYPVPELPTVKWSAELLPRQSPLPIYWLSLQKYSVTITLPVALSTRLALEEDIEVDLGLDGLPRRSRYVSQGKGGRHVIFAAAGATESKTEPG